MRFGCCSSPNIQVMNKLRDQNFLKRNGLSIVLLVLMLIFITGQAWTGLHVYNEERAEEGLGPVAVLPYLSTPHFRSALFENWESEFLQMGFYVLFTRSLFQIGSSESKDPDSKEEVDREPDPDRPGAPWPVRKGGWVLALYKNSLSIAFFLMFLLSFLGHFQGSYQHAVEEHMDKGQHVPSIGEYLISADFWFESFQNWQSEFLAVASIVILSIWLRQKGSPESKPVDAARLDTGG